MTGKPNNLKVLGARKAKEPKQGNNKVTTMV